MKRTSMWLVAGGLWLMAIALIAACAASSGGSGSDSNTEDTEDDTGGSDDSAKDDTAADDAADDAGDDTEAEECWETWARCEYENPIDGYTIDECGEKPDQYAPDSDRLAWEVCGYTIKRDQTQSRADCGFSGGCNDWKYTQLICSVSVDQAIIDCAVDSYANWENCSNEVWTTQSCNDI